MPPTEVPFAGGESAGARAGAAPTSPARRRRDALRAALAALAAGLASAGYAWVGRPVGPTRLVGVDYRAVVRRGQCRATWRAFSCTSLPVMRAGPLTPALLTAFADQASFEVNPWTRGVRWANHVRTLDDSLPWRAALDSTRRALAARHLEALPCGTADTHFPLAEAWRVGGQEVRLYAGWVHPRRPRAPTPTRPPPRVPPIPRPPRGYVVLHLVRSGQWGCGRDVPERHYVLLTPEEIARRAVDWLTGGGGE